MKKIVIALSLLGVGFSYFGQQEAMFTQYMFNTLSVNPGYAGSADMLSVNAISRHQWISIPGAPTTQTLVLHGPIKQQKIGVGLSVVNDKIGPTKDLSIYGDFSYRLNLSEKSSLSFGLKAGINNLSVNFDELKGTDENDVAFQQNITQLKPNFGFGIYYRMPKAYVGLSAPKLLEHQFTTGSASLLRNRHYFLIAGFVTELSENLAFKPTFLAKYTVNTPLAMDFTANFIIKDKVWLGAMYRLQDAVGAIVQLQLTEQLRLGYAYDHTLSKLRGYTGGSHEIMLNYDFNFSKDDIVSPRYF